jgi:hypothetical protein
MNYKVVHTNISRSILTLGIHGSITLRSKIKTFVQSVSELISSGSITHIKATLKIVDELFEKFSKSITERASDVIGFRGSCSDNARSYASIVLYILGKGLLNTFSFNKRLMA